MNSFIRVQWNYNNGLQGVVTSIFIVKIKADFLQNSLDVPELCITEDLLRSLVLCSAHWATVIRYEQLFD